jgi:DNA mismatch repair ATPase MutL
MKKAIKQVYSDIKSRYTPPFIYISLQVNPNHIDVNIHPTKNQVHLLDEDKIISKLVNVLDQALSDIPKTAKTKKQKSQRPLPKEATIDHYFKKAAQTNTESSESNRINTPPPSPQVNPLKVIQIACTIPYIY